jgi:hypothetical protein
MTSHVVVALPIIFIPVLQRIEASMIGDRCQQTPNFVEVARIDSASLAQPVNCCTVKRSVRIVVTLGVTLIAVLIPYLTELIAIVACLSIAFDVYIFPSLFMLQRCGASMRWYSKSVAWLIVLFGMVGAMAGLSQAVPELLAKIAENSASTDLSASS